MIRAPIIIAIATVLTVLVAAAPARAAGEGDKQPSPGDSVPANTQDTKEAKETTKPKPKPTPAAADQRAALCHALAEEEIAGAACAAAKPGAKKKALNGPRDLRSASPAYTQAQAAPVPAIVGEIASLLVEIAVDKAKRSGLEIVRAKARDAVCKLEYGGHKVLPAVCQLVSQVSLERLASSPDAIMIAMSSDLTSVALWIQSAAAPPELRPLTELAVKMTQSALARSPAAFAPSDTWALFGTVLSSLEDSNDPTVKTAVKVLRACVRLHNEQVEMACDPAFMVEAATVDPNGNPIAQVDPAEVVALVALGQKVLGEITDPKAQAATARLRFRDAVEFVFALAERTPTIAKAKADAAKAKADAAAREASAALEKASKEGNEQAKKASDDADRAAKAAGQAAAAAERNLDWLVQARRLLLAALDGNVPIVVSAGADLLISVLPSEQHASLQKANLIISAVGSYAETYSKLGAGTTAEEKEKVREARKQVLENLIDAATVRTDRYEEWVASIGMPIGFVAGVQKVRQTNAMGDTSFAGWAGMAPQLELAFGFALQRLPSKSAGVGLHLMALIVDLGQFASYDDGGQITQPRWDTVFAPGLQVGATLGTPSNVFVVGLEARYAPTLFSDNPGVGTATNGGAIRAGVFAAYHVSFFDLN